MHAPVGLSPKGSRTSLPAVLHVAAVAAAAPWLRTRSRGKVEIG